MKPKSLKDFSVREIAFPFNFPRKGTKTSQVSSKAREIIKFLQPLSKNQSNRAFSKRDSTSTSSIRTPTVFAVTSSQTFDSRNNEEARSVRRTKDDLFISAKCKYEENVIHIVRLG